MSTYIYIYIYSAAKRNATIVMLQIVLRIRSKWYELPWPRTAFAKSCKDNATLPVTHECSCGVIAEIGRDLWDSERAVKNVDLHLDDTGELESSSASNCESLHCQMESFKLTKVPSEVDQPCCISAPVIMTSPDGGSAIVGINAGGRITTLHGIFAFLKGSYSYRLCPF